MSHVVGLWILLSLYNTVALKKKWPIIFCEFKLFTFTTRKFQCFYITAVTFTWLSLYMTGRFVVILATQTTSSLLKRERQVHYNPYCSYTILYWIFISNLSCKYAKIPWHCLRYCNNSWRILMETTEPMKTKVIRPERKKNTASAFPDPSHNSNPSQNPNPNPYP